LLHPGRSSIAPGSITNPPGPVAVLAQGRAQEIVLVDEAEPPGNLGGTGAAGILAAFSEKPGDHFRLGEAGVFESGPLHATREHLMLLVGARLQAGVGTGKRKFVGQGIVVAAAARYRAGAGAPRRSSGA
jgi:hypothetical protein